MLGHVIHDHTLHKTLHQIYIVLSEIGTQSEEVRTPDKSFRKTFGEKEGNIRTRSEFSKIPTELDLKPFAWPQRCKSNSVNVCDKIKVQPNWQSRVSLDV